jgi:hypothetical protein
MVWAASSSAFDIRFAAMTVRSRLGKDGPGKGRRATWAGVEDHWGGGCKQWPPRWRARVCMTTLTEVQCLTLSDVGCVGIGHGGHRW